tara:strand:+ start:2109 stop:2777 length:669 start_codon:yes stop_codon:yes gene_type:complete
MKTVKINENDYDNIYLTSDTHYSHNKPWIIDDRNFPSVELHDAFLRDEYGKLTENDLLIHLGDWFLTCPEEKAKKFIEGIPCRTLTVFGNHTSYIKKIYQESLPEFARERDLDVFPTKLNGTNVELYGDSFALQLSKREVYLCQHYAPLTWDKMFKGELPPVLFGHSHSSLKGAQPHEDSIGRLLDCGVDNSIKYNKSAFFTLREVRNIFSHKNTVTNDHHG